MTKFEILVDKLLVSEYKMVYYNSDSEEVLMECFSEQEISELITLTRLNLKEDFSFRILNVFDTNYQVYIYNQPDVDKGIVKAIKEADELFEEYAELIYQSRKCT